MPPGRTSLSRKANTLATAATLALAATLLAACSCTSDDGDDDASGADDGTTATSEPTTTTVSVEEEVEAAYLAYAEMGARLLQAPDPTDPEIAERTTGEAQTDLVDGLTTLSSANQHYELGPNYGHEVLTVQVDGNQAVVDVCVVDDVRLVESQTGAVFGEGTTSARSDVTVVRQGESWVVAQVIERSVNEGTGGCTDEQT